MYEQFFGLRERPFDLTPNPRYLVLTESHREALSNLEYGIAGGKGITLLVGEAGSGKTTVIRAAIARQPGHVHCVHLHNPTLSREEFVEMLAARFALSERAARSKAIMLLELERLLKERREAGERTVLVVDEAQSLPLDLLEEIRLLVNIETDDTKLLSVIIAGQRELGDRLNDHALRQFKQRVALRCELRALTLKETAAYLAGRIHAAGGINSQVLTPDAVSLIHERTGGIPRMISVIADNALLGGFAAGEKPVGIEIVREVCRDFDIGGGQPGQAPGVRGPRPPSLQKALPQRLPVSGAPKGSAVPYRPSQLQPNGDAPRALDATKTPVTREPAGGSGAVDSKVQRDAPTTDMFAAFQGRRKRFSFFSN